MSSSPCYICSGPITELTLDPRDMKTKPCGVCLAIIDETANVGEEGDDFVAYIVDEEGFDEFYKKEFEYD